MGGNLTVQSWVVCSEELLTCYQDVSRQAHVKVVWSELTLMDMRSAREVFLSKSRATASLYFFTPTTLVVGSAKTQSSVKMSGVNCPVT